MIILGLDTETTGLDIQEDRVIELGYVLYDTERKLPVKLANFLIKDASMELSDEIRKLTGIHDTDLSLYGIQASIAFNLLSESIEKAEAVVAHNGLEYDYPLIDNECKRAGIPAIMWPHKLDTMVDLPLNAPSRSNHLSYLAADHEFLNPFPHRALTDVLTMLKIMSKYNFEDILARSRSPRVVVRAIVDYDHKDLARDKKFRWQEVGSHKFDKCWVKIIKDCDFEQLKSECNFQVARIKNLD